MHGSSDAATPEEYIAGLDEPRRHEVQRLHDLVRASAPSLAPVMVGRMLGYGPYHYRYASGREGDAAVVQIASNKQAISVYVVCVEDGRYLAEAAAASLGKVSVGKSCIRIRKLEDVDLDALGDLLRAAERIGPPHAA